MSYDYGNKSDLCQIIGKIIPIQYLDNILYSVLYEQPQLLNNKFLL
jgi:hypothetical protein